ncbi:MAG TPA: exo-alpha-sialidase [Acetobacteraceae bacterium]|nr:exo-alpha-sialidase [Acetobacteraceae bacterium]
MMQADPGRLMLLVATRKGAFVLHGDAARRDFRMDGPHFLGHVIHHVVLDPRDRLTMLMAVSTGHLGPTVFRSSDFGATWQEAEQPPRFPKAAEGTRKRAVDHVFWLTPGHSCEPGVWYAGTSPQGLFRSEDGGRSWNGVAGLNDHPMLDTWTGGEQDGTPDGPKLHSILIDPRDKRRMYVGMSSGGVFVTDDQGTAWRPLNRGSLAEFLPNQYPDYGQDPHRVMLHPLRPDRLYQQNHCGIYRMDLPEEHWTRIGERMPAEIGDIGLPLALHPRDPDTAWVIPMDGSTVWPRVSPGGRPAVYATRDAGEKWRRLDQGLPREQAWFTVKRQSFGADTLDPVGLYFGTTGGSLWASSDEGERWRCIAEHLPEIYAVEAALV